MDVILIPGLWLDASSWEQVVPTLLEAGHRPHPLTLPGVGEMAGDRAAVRVSDQVAAVVAAIDAAPEPVALVAHSASGGIAHAAVDARPERVARVFYVGGFPTGDGSPVVNGFTASEGAIELPEWPEFDDADLVDLDDAALARFREIAVPSPECAVRDPLRLTDERRYEVPVTAVCPEYRSEALKTWVSDGLEPVRELAKIKNVEYVDLPTGHWPQFTRPVELAKIISERLPTGFDAQGRRRPPVAGDEAATLLGFLEFQRATLAWKCRGLSADGLNAALPPSAMTLGGLLKHLAWVEDYWFSQFLHGHPAPAPWDTVDWAADRDWEWHSAAGDTPEELFALWTAAVEQARSLTARALAQDGLATLARRRIRDGRPVSLRWIVCHVTQEYARHNGHADLLRESIDGRIGE